MSNFGKREVNVKFIHIVNIIYFLTECLAKKVLNRFLSSKRGNSHSDT